ncbi:hypothetical protein ACWEFJ_35125 [Actinosynnema sp. NPDC004786]
MLDLCGHPDDVAARKDSALEKKTGEWTAAGRALHKKLGRKAERENWLDYLPSKATKLGSTTRLEGFSTTFSGTWGLSVRWSTVRRMVDGCQWSHCGCQMAVVPGGTLMVSLSDSGEEVDRAVIVAEFSGEMFEVASVSSVIDDEERYEFLGVGPGKFSAPSVAIARKDSDPTATLYVSIEGEIALPVLEAMIVYARKGLV